MMLPREAIELECQSPNDFHGNWGTLKTLTEFYFVAVSVQKLTESSVSHVHAL